MIAPSVWAIARRAEADTTRDLKDHAKLEEKDQFRRLVPFLEMDLGLLRLPRSSASLWVRAMILASSAAFPASATDCLPDLYSDIL